MQAALDLLADLMTNCRECLREGLVLLLRLMFALEPQLEFRWRLQPEAIIRRVTFVLLCGTVSCFEAYSGCSWRLLSHRVGTCRLTSCFAYISSRMEPANERACRLCLLFKRCGLHVHAHGRHSQTGVGPPAVCPPHNDTRATLTRHLAEQHVH